MNKSILFLCAIALAIVSIPQITHATVGGPTFISDIRYDEAANNIYYVRNSFGGKGCPPTINRLNVTSGVTTNSGLITCSTKNYSQIIDSFAQNFKGLPSVNLRKNNISASMRVVGKEEFSSGSLLRTKFEITLSQNGREKGVFKLDGCFPDQPILIAGYPVPNTKNMALLFSGKLNCFEGGYIYEKMAIVEDVIFTDTTTVEWYKRVEALQISSGTLVVYAEEKPTTVPTPQVNPPVYNIPTVTNPELPKMTPPQEQPPVSNISTSDTQLPDTAAPEQDKQSRTLMEILVGIVILLAGITVGRSYTSSKVR